MCTTQKSKYIKNRVHVNFTLLWFTFHLLPMEKNTIILYLGQSFQVNNLFMFLCSVIHMYIHTYVPYLPEK